MRQQGVCRDSAKLFTSGLTLSGSALGLKVEYSPIEAQGSEPLRTRCPGPALGSALASAVVPLTALGRRRFTLALYAGTRFDDQAYGIRTASTLSFALKRTSVVQQVYRTPPPLAGDQPAMDQGEINLRSLVTLATGHLPS